MKLNKAYIHRSAWSCYPVCLVLLVCVGLYVTACNGSGRDGSDRQMPYGDVLKAYQDNGLQVESVPISKPVHDPLQAALTLIGLEADNLARPHALEENYRLLARNPVIDRFAQNPLQMAHWAEEMSTSLQNTEPDELIAVVDQMIRHLNGGVTYADRLPPMADYSGGLAAAYDHLCRQNGRASAAGAHARIQQAGFAPDFERLLAELVYALTAASELSRKAVADLSAAEIDYITKQPERFFFKADGTFRFLTAPTYNQGRLVRLARKIDFPTLMTAGLILARAVDRVTDAVQNNAALERKFPFFNDGHAKTGVILELETPVGPIIVLGTDNNILNRSAALVVDLGGDDRYTAPVAAGHLVPGRSALHIDLGGNDYYGKKKLSFAQGVGCLSVGLLADYSGQDEYYAAHMAQGCGLYGLGMMIDFSGDDLYSMGLMGQGFGLFGFGLLLDRDGNDRYLTSGMAQGAGSTMGHGVLCDVRGNDKYLADRRRRRPGLKPDAWCHAQGAGLSIRSSNWAKQASFYGGIGLLSDGEGNDFYHATGGNCMGSSYFMSVGALVEHGGNDTYLPEKGYGVGFAVHLSNAVLVDKGGNDQYLAASHTGGVGSDRSRAMLVDFGGNDLYGPSPQYVQQAQTTKRVAKSTGAFSHHVLARELATLSYGATQKRKALGLTIDLKGNDRYYAKMQGQGESCGGVMPPKFPQHWSHAVLLDLSGEDYYELPGRRDNTYFKYHHHGVCYDTASAGKALPDQAAMVIGAPRSLSEALYNAALATPYDRVNIKKLLDRDLFVRFAALGELLQGGLPVLHSMLAVLASSPDRELNRDLLEVLNAYFLAGQMNSQFISALEALLTAPDPYVQQSAARFLGALKQPGALAALSRALPVVAQETRVHVIWALGNIGSHDALGPLLALAPPQASNLIDRRAAVEALKTVALQKPFLTATDKQTIRSSLSALVNDGDEIIRFHAVMGLNSFKEDPAVLALVRAKLDDASIYVQRAAAHTVIEAGHKEGIPILIASLRFPSIDTFEFYDEDLPKDLAFYCGIDFPDDQRYDHRTWQQWWQKHQKEVNLSHNLAIKREIEAAFATYPEQSGLATFDRLMQTETGNRMIMRRYGRFCRDRIRYLLGHQKMTREIIARCVALQRRLVALEPDNPKTLKQLQLFETQLSGYG